MEFTIHHQILVLAFVIAAIMGAVANKTNFCTMGAVSDWVNMGDKGRLRAWLFAMTVAIIGVLALERSGTVTLPPDTFPPYRTEGFAWLRYLLGGVMFGIGMTLASGCGNKTFIRIGGGNLKSVVVFVIAATAAYQMLWTEFYNDYFNSWISATTVRLSDYGISGQDLGTIAAGVTGADAAAVSLVVSLAVVIGLLVYIFRSEDFRGSFDNILGGLVIGLAVVAGWYLTGSSMGTAWKEFAEFAAEPPSRVAVQSYTFISPMGDSVRYALQGGQFTLLNFGIMALAGVVVGSFLYAVLSRSFRIEWFASFKDFLSHAIGAVLMGIGGVLSMGCTIGQAVTGVSTLALGSFLTFFAIVFGSALTMKVQYYMMDEQNFFQALRSALGDLRLLPRRG